MLIHQGSIFLSLSSSIPRISLKWRCNWFSIQHPSLFCTNPHATLLIEIQHIHVSHKSLATQQPYLFMVYQRISLQIVLPISIGRRNIKHAILVYHVIQTVILVQEHSPLPFFRREAQQHSMILSISDLKKSILCFQHQR